MTQLDILSKNFMGVDTKCINIVRVGSTHPYDMKFEVLYTENMNFLAKQCGGYRSNYSRQGGNQGLARCEGWKDRDREWRDQNPTLKDVEKDRHVTPHERQKLKDP